MTLPFNSYMIIVTGVPKTSEGYNVAKSLCTAFYLYLISTYPSWIVNNLGSVSFHTSSGDLVINCPVSALIPEF